MATPPDHHSDSARAPEEWLQHRSYDPFKQIMGLANGFCKPQREMGDERTHIGKVILVDQLENLKKVLQNVRGGVYNEKSAVVTGEGFDGCAESTAATQSVDSSDTAKVDELKEEEENLAILTRPGTSRAVRVQRSLETFFLAVLLLYFTMHFLRRFDNELGVEVYAREIREFDFFSISWRS